MRTKSILILEVGERQYADLGQPSNQVPTKFRGKEIVASNGQTSGLILIQNLAAFYARRPAQISKSDIDLKKLAPMWSQTKGTLALIFKKILH